MKKLHPLRAFRSGAPAFAAGLMLLSLTAATGLAQTSGGSTTDSQADRDVEAARRAAGTDTTSGNLNMNGSAGVGATGTGAAGTGTNGTGAGRARPSDDAAAGVDRSRQQNLPGARPGDAPAQQPGGAPAPQPGAATTNTDTSSGSSSSVGSSPGAGLGGMPSNGASASTTSGSVPDTTTTARDTRTTARMIGETSFAYRDRAMQMVERELSSGGSLSSSILRGSEALSGAARTRVNDSVTRANEARTELAKAISRARAANENRWESTRSDVVKRYEAYMKALDEARAAATAGGVQLQDAAGTAATMPTP